MVFACRPEGGVDFNDLFRGRAHTRESALSIHRKGCDFAADQVAETALWSGESLSWGFRSGMPVARRTDELEVIK
jgi:hypothetical protein